MNVVPTEFTLSQKNEGEMGANQSAKPADTIESVKSRFFEKASAIQSVNFSKDVLQAMNRLVRAKRAERQSKLPIDSNEFAALVANRVKEEAAFNKRMDDISKKMRNKIKELEDIQSEVNDLRVRIRESPFSEAQRAKANEAQADLEAYVQTRVAEIQQEYAKRMAGLRETLASAMQSLEK